MAVITFDRVDVIFGRRVKEALALLDAGADKDRIFEETGQVVGVQDASLQVEAGEIFVLMGLSGSGKSTLLRCVNGLNQATRGRVLIDDGGRQVDVTDCDPKLMRRLRMNRVSMVFQQFALMPWRTIAANVAFGLEVRGVPKAERRERVVEVLEQVGLGSWLNHYPHELSGGMQQRVGLARAFATDAEILLMDEPFSALDPLIRERLQDELLALQQTLRRTILFVSHDLDEALKIGTRIAIMEGGRIIQVGPPEQIVTEPADEYVRQFVANVNPLNVLRGVSLMRPLASLRSEDGIHLLDDASAMFCRLDGDGRPEALSLEGAPAQLVPYREDLDLGALGNGEIVAGSPRDDHAHRAGGAPRDRAGDAAARRRGPADRRDRGRRASGGAGAPGCGTEALARCGFGRDGGRRRGRCGPARRTRMKGTPMARRFQRLALILLALVVAPAASAHYVDLNEALHSEDTLTVGVALTGQPFAYKQDGVLRGFEVEMAEAVAEAHGLALEVVRLPRGKLAAALAAGNVDVANTLAMEAGTAGIKTVPYLVIGDHLMVLRGNPFRIKEAGDLSGRVASVTSGSSAERFAHALNREFEEAGRAPMHGPLLPPPPLDPLPSLHGARAGLLRPDRERGGDHRRPRIPHPSRGRGVPPGARGGLRHQEGEREAPSCGRARRRRHGRHRQVPAAAGGPTTCRSNFRRTDRLYPPLSRGSSASRRPSPM